jgi:hypothetical protein
MTETPATTPSNFIERKHKILNQGDLTECMPIPPTQWLPASDMQSLHNQFWYRPNFGEKCNSRSIVTNLEKNISNIWIVKKIFTGWI